MALNLIPWSDMELAQLKELAGEYPAPHISAQIGRSTEGVRKMIKKLGLTSFPNPADRKAAPKTQKPSVRKEEEKVGESKLNPVQEHVHGPTAIRKAKVTHISYPHLEWCPQCHSPVSDWDGHFSRMGHKRPAA